MPQLKTYQEEAVTRMVSLLLSKGGVLNRYAVGRGKTAMTIETINRLRARPVGSPKRVLIIAPSSLKEKWRQELNTWLAIPMPTLVLDRSTKANVDSLKRFGDGVVIIGDHTLHVMVTWLNVWKPDMVVTDEIHREKSPSTKRSKALKQINCKYRVGLSATLSANNPLDVWAPTNWSNPGLLPTNFYQFRNIYADVYTGAGFPIIRGYRNLEDLKKRLDSVSAIGSPNDELEIHPKSYNTIPIRLSAKEQKAYDAMAKTMVMSIENDTIEASTVLVQLLRLRQITSGFVQSEGTVVPLGDTKLQALADLIESIEGRVIVWTSYVYEVMVATKLTGKMGRQIFTLTGATPVNDRQNEVNGFNASTNGVMIANPMCGGVGLDMPGTPHAVFLSNSWSFIDRGQAEGRNYGGNRTQCKVVYHDLIANDTIDVAILEALNKKANMNKYFQGGNVNDINDIVRGKINCR